MPQDLHFMRFRTFGYSRRQIPEKLEFANKNEFKANRKSPGENGVEQSILFTLGIKTGSD